MLNENDMMLFEQKHNDVGNYTKFSLLIFSVNI